MKKNLIAASAVALGLAMSGVASAGTSAVAGAQPYYGSVNFGFLRYNNDILAPNGLNPRYELGAGGFQVGMNFGHFKVGLDWLGVNDVNMYTLQGTYALPVSDHLSVLANVGAGKAYWKQGHSNHATTPKENHTVYNYGVGVSMKLSDSYDLSVVYNVIEPRGVSNTTAATGVVKGHWNVFKVSLSTSF